MTAVVALFATYAVPIIQPDQAARVPRLWPTEADRGTLLPLGRAVLNGRSGKRSGTRLRLPDRRFFGQTRAELSVRVP